ncbi:outer membrane beta-barrel protein [Cerasicoccus arenae]|uniref:Uncharacterized protein n=1 Tax=Cerasicoccus arenae TaxID=424488 RepID=A0A8J3D762_9BACT|nr:outer membrane beta-barrel protein [Cerasicoccus arenae]MBK1857032.1 outer membrane beta-barrel protein [Cerasicoccus arenae]GHB91965.1 hypothetical protein GCM10007047_03640 [Cerasicoccus arenae]
MHKRNILLSATACIALASQVNALFPVMGGEVGVSLNTKYGYSSNINANSGEEGDDILTITPAVQFIRRQGIVTLDVGAGVSIIRYDKTGNSRSVVTPTILSPFGFVITPQKGNNSVDPFFYLKLAGPNGVTSPLTAQLLFDFRRVTEANDLVGELTSSYNYNVVADLNYKLSDRFSIGVSPSFQYQDYRTSGFSDVLSASLATDLQYNYSELLSFDAGYRFRYEYTPSSRNGPTYESMDHTLFAGAFGVIAPKVTGNAQVGLTYRDWIDPNTESNFVYPYVNIGLEWAYDDKTTFGLNAGVDLGQSPGNQGLETAGAGITASHEFTDQWSANAAFDYTHTFFTGVTNRRDDSFIFGGGLLYKINEWANAGLNGSYQFNDSDVNTFHYNSWQVFGNVGVHF